ncbi:MAG: ATP-dependent protease ATPase subunit HslU, partial [Hyphomicrobiaceae bacterium]|nr:ATP-dependent protease ATPase subunit HslU [Hyphomicrobiaceae bacterium]
EELRNEITPKNILMIGPTGVGKTEIARRLARLAKAPFIKVEATKYTEVGYVGRDVESIVRDLVDFAIKMVREEHLVKVQTRAEEAAEEHLLNILIPHSIDPAKPISADKKDPQSDSREKMRHKLRLGELDNRQVEIDMPEQAQIPMLQMFTNQGGEEMDLNLKDMLGSLGGGKKKTKRMTVKEAMGALKQQEADQLLDMDRIKEEAIERTENSGIVFLDEMDKITHRSGKDGDVSREGVQRDLLPLIEGTTISTKYGPVKTDHVLFIASGAFHVAKPSDLLPELQGRLPIRVELRPLTREDFRRILTEPEASLIKQYVALMGTENLALTFTDDAVDALADTAAQVNSSVEDIGARRLQTVMERVLDEISFDASDRGGQSITIDAEYVTSRLGDLAKNTDLSKFIL